MNNRGQTDIFIWILIVEVKELFSHVDLTDAGECGVNLTNENIQ